MKGLAYSILGIIFLANLIQPLTEMAEACRQKVVISSALNNSFRAARDRCITEESLKNLDAEVDVDLFYEYFSEALCDSLYLSESGRSIGTSGYLEFNPWNDLFNSIRVEIDIDDASDFYDDKEMTRITLHAETDYKFKIGALKLLEDKTKYSNYTLEFDRTYLLLVKN